MEPHNITTGHPGERVEVVDLSPSAAIAFVCASGFICLLLLLAYCRCYCNESDGAQLMRLLRRRKPAGSLSLPVVFYRRKAEEGLAPGACVVCLSDFVDKEAVKVIPGCGHVFHAQCIDMWLASQRSCPVCRCSKLSGGGEKDGEPDEEEAAEQQMEEHMVVRMERSRSWCCRGSVDHGGQFGSMGMRRTCSF